MNLPNKLTLGRIFAIPFFLFFLLFGLISASPVWIFISHIVALLIYIAAMITDIIDGNLARKHNLVTRFGKLFDPLADKILNCSALVAMIELNLIPSWIVIVILAREFMVTGMRSLALVHNRVIAADRWGKNKTTSQVTLIIYGICFLAVKDFLALNWVTISEQTQNMILTPLQWIFYVIVGVCLLLTVGSGANYLIKNSDLITDKESRVPEPKNNDGKMNAKPPIPDSKAVS